MHVWPASMYAAETWALTERLEELLASCDYVEIHVKSKIASHDY